MTPIAEIIAGAREEAAGLALTIPGDWMQGRTAYGGLSAALALEAAFRVEPDLPPLRSAQVAFIGPLAGEVHVSATRLRRGRNAAFVQADVSGESGLGLRATFVFMASLESRLHRDAAPRAPVGPPAPDAKLYIGPDDFFTGNFAFHDIKTGTSEAEWLRWAKLRDTTGLHPMLELMAIGDGLPPGAYKLLGGGNAPLSSLNWSINLLATDPATEDGWWLLNSIADTAIGGVSSQRMTIWNAAGEAVAEAMQSVAVYA